MPPPIPTECTWSVLLSFVCQRLVSERRLCSNNVFFNLYSACLLSHGNMTLPISKDWGTQCKQKSFNLTVGYSHKDDFNIPSWAFALVADDSTFDVSVALASKIGPLFHVPHSPYVPQLPKRKAGQQCKKLSPCLQD